MNFLSHYYFDRHVVSPSFVLGLTFPDLFRSVYKSNRKTIHVKLRSLSAPRSDAELFLYGIMRHEQLDSLFHQSGYFHKITGALRTHLNQQSFNTITGKKYFLAHLLAEILLDWQIVKQYPEIDVKYHALLGEITYPVFKGNYLGNSITPSDMRQDFSKLKRFCSKPFALKWRNYYGLASYVSGIFGWVLGIEITTGDVRMLEAIMPEMDLTVRKFRDPVYLSLEKELARCAI